MGQNASGADVVTTTYGYDAFGTRVLQTGTSTTNIYPFKWYSIASSTATGAKYSTTTEYIFNGDTLVSTVDQQFKSGVATGSPQTLYIHPDHLGSTNVVTNASGTVVKTLDYYPYGGTRISSGQNATSRQYIGQFSDPSNLDYLQARYYDPSRGQFISQDPTFLAVGNPTQLQQLSKQSQQQFLSDPQQLNSYSYGRDNPITRKDPDGNQEVVTDSLLLAYFSPEALALLETSLGWFGRAMTAIDLYNAKTTFVDTPSPSAAEKRDAIGSLAYDALLLPAGARRFATPAERFALDALEAARQGLFQINSFGATSKPSFVVPTAFQGSSGSWNSLSYAQNVGFSQATGQPSYTGPSAGGGNPSYASQTYVLPNGKITDWFGNIIPAQTTQPPPPPPPAKH
jgi:RHS repeat-associated protein